MTLENVTGAATRGNKTTSAFAASTFGVRTLSQSLYKEFRKQNIHASHAIINGPILTGASKARVNDAECENESVRLGPQSIAKSNLYLMNQDRSAWSWKLDLWPAHENW